MDQATLVWSTRRELQERADAVGILRETNNPIQLVAFSDDLRHRDWIHRLAPR
jgi:hypothetical protein